MKLAALALALAVLICFPSVFASPAVDVVPDPLAVATMAAPTSSPVPALPACRIADVATPLDGYDDWRLTLLDTTYTLPSDYAPPDLVSTSEAGLGAGFMVRAFVIPDLQAMVHDAAKAGAPLAVESAYRSYSLQKGTFWRWSKRLGPIAVYGSARPGHSEHQLGTVIDFRSRNGPTPWSYYSWARDTPAGRWMAANAWKYGFVMSYPSGRGITARTCYGFEPWHYRYVGRDEAAAIHASGLTLREWLWRHQADAPSSIPTLHPGE